MTTTQRTDVKRKPQFCVARPNVSSAFCFSHASHRRSKKIVRSMSLFARSTTTMSATAAEMATEKPTERFANHQAAPVTQASPATKPVTSIRYLMRRCEQWQ